MFWTRENWGESKKKEEEGPFPLFLFLLSPQFWRGQNIATSHGKACYAGHVTYGQGNAPRLGSPQFLFLPWIRPLNLLLHLTVLWMTRLLLPIVFLFAPLLPLILYYNQTLQHSRKLSFYHSIKNNYILSAYLYSTQKNITKITLVKLRIGCHNIRAETDRTKSLSMKGYIPSVVVIKLRTKRICY